MLYELGQLLRCQKGFTEEVSQACRPGAPSPPGHISSPGQVQWSAPFPSAPVPLRLLKLPAPLGSALGLPLPGIRPPPRPPLLCPPDPCPAHLSTKACPGPAASAQDPPGSVPFPVGMRPSQSAHAELIVPEKARQGQPVAGLIRRGFSEAADVVEGTQVPGKEDP